MNGAGPVNANYAAPLKNAAATPSIGAHLT
jgi:hypothetical protein